TLPNDWISATATSKYADYASMVRTGSGDISIATAGDLVLQSPNSLIYTAGTGHNVNGTAAQPLSGFTQYTGSLYYGQTTLAPTTQGDYLPPCLYLTHGGDGRPKIE